MTQACLLIPYLFIYLFNLSHVVVQVLMLIRLIVGLFHVSQLRGAA